MGIKSVMIAGLLLTSGCSHQLEVINLREYSNYGIGTAVRPLSIGIISSADDPATSRLAKEIGRSLQSNSHRVHLPYYPNGAQEVDAIIRMNIQPEYSGSPWNFLVSWPGFIIWMPAIHGYNYTAYYYMDLSITATATNTVIDDWSVPINIRMRHASFDRTWIELGWLEWGIMPLIGGIVFTTYDQDVTPLMLDKIERPIGDFVAQQIIDRLNGFGVGVPMKD